MPSYSQRRSEGSKAATQTGSSAPKFVVNDWWWACVPDAPKELQCFLITEVTSCTVILKSRPGKYRVRYAIKHVDFIEKCTKKAGCNDGR